LEKKDLGIRKHNKANNIFLNFQNRNTKAKRTTEKKRGEKIKTIQQENKKGKERENQNQDKESSESKIFKSDTNTTR
jgi:hypothetical protein